MVSSLVVRKGDSELGEAVFVGTVLGGVEGRRRGAVLGAGLSVGKGRLGGAVLGAVEELCLVSSMVAWKGDAEELCLVVLCLVARREMRWSCA